MTIEEADVRVQRSGVTEVQSVRDQLRWRGATRDLVVSGADCLVTAASPVSQPAVFAVLLSGRVLNTDLAIAECHDMQLKDGADQVRLPSQMTFTPLRLGSLSGVPTLTIRATGLIEPVSVEISISLRVADRCTGEESTLMCALQNVNLSADAPSVRRDWPLPTPAG